MYTPDSLTAAKDIFVRSMTAKPKPAVSVGDLLGKLVTECFIKPVGSLAQPVVQSVLWERISPLFKPAAAKGLPGIPKILFGMGGAAAGIGGVFLEGIHHCPKKIEQALHDHHFQCNSTVRQLEGNLTNQSKRLEESGSLLQDTKRQNTVFLALSLSLLVVCVALTIIAMYQNLRHKEERHKWTVAHNLQSEKALQDKLEQQKKKLEEQRKELQVALEEKRIHQNLIRSHNPAHHGQPLVLTLPTGLAQAAGDLQGNRV